MVVVSSDFSINRNANQPYEYSYVHVHVGKNSLLADNNSPTQSTWIISGLNQPFQSVSLSGVEESIYY